jgi:glycosidase
MAINHQKGNVAMKRSMPLWLSSAVFYEIYPQSFNDTNGDGIGDLPGITSNLDYIKGVGCDAIWINPCFVSPFQDAGYDISDYYKVAPRYGTNADLKHLFAQAHKRGMHVIVDLVPGHTSNQHPWFKESCKPERNKYTDWYIWTDDGWKSAAPHFQSISAYADRNGQYITNFFYMQPALNYGFARPEKSWQQPYDAPGPMAVRAELKKIMRFWLDMGADGFRVDMAASLVKGDRGCKYLNKLWGEIRGMLDKDYPEAMLVSEWGRPDDSIRAGFHADFMLHFGPPAYNSLFRQWNEKKESTSYFSRGGKGDITGFLKYYLDIYKGTPGRGHICIPSGNHDMSRLAEGRTDAELEVAFTFLLTMPGMPFIYYGDEIGMKQVNGLHSKEGGLNRTASRTPMQWSNGRNAGFSIAPESKLYLPVDKRPGRPTVENQDGSHRSLLSFVRRMIALRRATPALSNNGLFAPVYAKKSAYPFIYQRTLGKERYVIAVNPSGDAVKVSFVIAKSPRGLEHVVGKGSAVRKSGARYVCEMSGVSYGVYRVV